MILVKKAIRDAILLKQGKSTDEERKEMEEHTIIDAKILISTFSNHR